MSRCSKGTLAQSDFELILSLIHQMDANGVQKAVLIQHGGMYDNAYLLDCAARHKGRFSVVGMVDEASPSAPDDLVGWAERGVTGVRLTPSSPLSLWKTASETGLAVSCRQDVRAFAVNRLARQPSPVQGIQRPIVTAPSSARRPWPPAHGGPRSRGSAREPNVEVALNPACGGVGWTRTL